MFGDTPPVVVAVDGDLVRTEGLAAFVEQQLARHPLRLVTQEAARLRSVLETAGLRTGPGVDVASGDLEAAVALAAERGAATVRIWTNGAAEHDLPMPARIAAHDAGIRFRLEAPLAGS